MRNSKINYVAVGAFVSATLVGMIITIALLTGRTGATDSYYAMYRNVSGVKFGTQVVFEGYQIGQVEEITPLIDGKTIRFKISLEVQEGWKIPDDSSAQIFSSGLLSPVVISIKSGKSEIALKPGNTIPSKESANIFAAISEVAGEMSELSDSSLKPLLSSVNRAVRTFEKILGDDGKELVKEIRIITQEISKKIPGITENVSSFSRNLNSSGNELNALLSSKNRIKVEGLIADISSTMSNFSNISSGLSGSQKKMDDLLVSMDQTVDGNKNNIDKAVKDLRYILGAVAEHVQAFNQNMEATSRNMYEFSRQIRQNPGLLLGGTPPNDAAAN
jgi:phospholipid/cholesterol/gamma-HCH transport system substrate-binding protein